MKKPPGSNGLKKGFIILQLEMTRTHYILHYAAACLGITFLILQKNVKVMIKILSVLEAHCEALMTAKMMIAKAVSDPQNLSLVLTNNNSIAM